MEVTTYTLRYTERRSANYQSVEVSGEATVTLAEGETITQAHDFLLKTLVPTIRKSGDRGIERYDPTSKSE